MCCHSVGCTLYGARCSVIEYLLSMKEKIVQHLPPQRTN
jgi:hypothetical protein